MKGMVLVRSQTQWYLVSGVPRLYGLTHCCGQVIVSRGFMVPHAWSLVTACHHALNEHFWGGNQPELAPG